jgi:signal transduction histidine kinase
VSDISKQRNLLPSRTPVQSMLDDHVLLGAFVVCALLIGYQLTVILLQPPWIKLVTNWLRAALAWPQLFVIAWVSLHLLRTRQPGAVAWCFAALGLLSYTLARTTWTLADVFIYPQGVPFPSLPDLFFIMQYPCFVIALFVIPTRGRWLPGLRTMVDAVLWMSAITALSWYFVLVPLSLQTYESALGKSISVFYQICDLVLLYGLIMVRCRPRRTTSDVVVLFLLSLAVISLFVADTWAAVLLLQPPHTYQTGSWPDLFWFTCYLLLPLAALARMRLYPAQLPAPFRPERPIERINWGDVLASTRFILPSLAVVVASAVIVVHATLISHGTTGLIQPEVVAIALLLLATLRLAVMYIDQEWLRRERDAARVQENALRLANERMEAYLSIVAHELKTPLSSLIGNVQLMTRRLDTLLRLVRNHQEYSDTASVLHALIDWCDQSLGRMARLVDDVLDETRVRQGRFVLRLKECDLVGVAGHAVAEQLALNPERSIRWIVEASPVPVLADAGRIEQVVTNFLSNALKFSRADQTVEVRVRTEDAADWAGTVAGAHEAAGVARVSVHDDGPGVSLADQLHIWERYYQAKGVDVKSGSQVGFGIGLYISKAIVEGHRGQVGVESATGQGATFWFTLPLAPLLAKEEAPGPAS